MYLGEIIMSNPRENSLLFKEVEMGSIKLKNRMVMSPMTRSRSINNIPSDLVAKYYEQRAGAGLIITEGTSPSPNGLGYPRIPGAYSEEQKEGWKKVADAVHKHGSKIFIQFMHTGRVSHPDNLPNGAKHIAPSAIGITGEMWTDANGLQKYPIPEEMTAKDIEDIKKCEVFNLGTNTSISSLNILIRLFKLYNKKVAIFFKKKSYGEPDKLLSSIVKAKKILNWKPTRNINQILKDALLLRKE